MQDTNSFLTIFVETNSTEMIAKSTFEFLCQLRDNNYREWFNANKARYEAAREDAIAFAEQLRQHIHAFDPEIALDYPIKRTMFRIYRDTRFSRNKEPYKTHFGIVLNGNGVLKNPLASYYLNIGPQECYVASGCYCPEPSLLKLLRDAFDLDWELFEQDVLGDKMFMKHIGGLSHEERMLKRVPNGYPKDSPAADYLKLTSFYGYAKIDDDVMCSPEALEQALTLCRALKPLKEFLNRAIRYEED